MGEHPSVAEVTALRREARRRKILDNSKNRLKLIEGINSTFEETPSESSPKPESEPEVKETESNEETFVSDSSNSSVRTKINEIIRDSEGLREISDFLLRDAKDVDKGELEDEETITEVDLKRGKTYLELVLEKRLHYVVLALIVNILLSFNAGFLFYENIFCPFYTLKTIEILSRRSSEAEEFQPFLFLFTASLPKRIQKFAKFSLPILIASFSDLCVYIFTFVIGTKIINTEV